MPTTTPNTIIYKGRLSRRYEEGRVKSGSTIYPGMLIEKHTDGTLKPHATSGGVAIKAIAIEDGFGAGGPYPFTVAKKLTDPYNTTDLVRYVILEPGDQFYWILKDGEVAVIGSMLVSNADGKCQVLAGSEVAIAQALEALSPSGSDLYVLCEAL